MGKRDAVGAAVGTAQELTERRLWGAAQAALLEKQTSSGLAAEELEALALCTYLLGQETQSIGPLEEAFRLYSENGRHSDAFRCAFWSGLTLMHAGKAGPAVGWISKARELQASCPASSGAEGYLLLPQVEMAMHGGEFDTARDLARQAAETARRCGDTDLWTIAHHLRGKAELKSGNVEPGLQCLDEAMVSLSSDELSPRTTGLVYCSVLDGCRDVFAYDRAWHWTEALNHWCEAQPGLVTFTGQCLVHRAEMSLNQGKWSVAFEEAEAACERFVIANKQHPQADARYQQAEVHRLRGQLEEAESVFAEVSRLGGSPQPGLALLRMAQGRTEEARRAIETELVAKQQPVDRARLLAPAIEIAVHIDDLDGAKAHLDEMKQISAKIPSEWLAARLALADGQVGLAQGRPAEVIPGLRRAAEYWQELGAPYHAARAWLLAGQACRFLGDSDGCANLLTAARRSFEELGAQADLRYVQTLQHSTQSGALDSVLSGREVEVLKCVAAGMANKEIAKHLHLSPKTIERHLTNIFNKLDVGSRAGAVAHALRNQMI